MEINRIGNKNCWIKNWFQHWWFFNRGDLLIRGDHLFLNYNFFWGQRRLINTAGIINPNLALLYTIYIIIYEYRIIYIYLIQFSTLYLNIAMQIMSRIFEYCFHLASLVKSKQKTILSHRKHHATPLAPWFRSHESVCRRRIWEEGLVEAGGSSTASCP